MKELAKQRPDVILRQRKRSALVAHEYRTTERLQPEANSSSGMFLKLAFWALSAGVGTMAFVVATTAKKWM